MITVGVAAYNAASEIPNLLNSLLAQDYPTDRMEIVVADNGSSDETIDVVGQYARRGPIRLVRACHRRGPAVARNAILKEACGDIIAYTDHDCVAHPQWLAEIVDGFSDPIVGCVAGEILPAEPRTPVEKYYVRRKILSQEWVMAHPFLPYAQTANASFRTDVLRHIGGFDEDLITSEDADVIWRMQLMTKYRIKYCPNAVVWHRHRSTARDMWRQTVGWGIGHAILYSKYRRYMHRDPLVKLLWEYRRLVGLGILSIKRWIAVGSGALDRGSLEDAYLTLLFHSGIRFGRLKGSLKAGVFYP